MGGTKYSIKRAICVWALWLSVLLCFALPALWVTSYFIDRSESCLAIGHRFFAILRDGRIELSSDLNTDSGYPRPAVINPRLIIAPKVIQSESVNLPGFELHICCLAGGTWLWSLSLSPLIPIVISAGSAALLFHRLRRSHPRGAAVRRNAC